MQPFDDSHETLNLTYLRHFIAECEADRAAGKHPQHVAEGDRLSDEFRRQFPNVSDRDLGTLIVVFTNVLGYVCQTDLLSVSYILENVIASYGYCASNILKNVMDLDEMQ